MSNEAKHDKLIEELIKDPIYRIRKDGTIWGYKPCSGPNSPYRKHKLRKLGTNRKGYIIIRYNNKLIRAHRIVYRNFIGPLDSHKVVNHVDGRKSNNRPENLELITHEENRKHALESGFILKGEKVHCAKLTYGQVLAIKSLLKAQYRVRAIARRFKVHHSIIIGIRKKSIWKHVEDKK